MSYHIDATKNSALAFLLGAVLVGGVFGFTADRLVTRDRVCPRWGDEAAMRRRFGDELGLTEAQRAAVDTILSAKHRAVQALVLPMRPQLDSIADNANRQIKARLDASQQAMFDRMLTEVKDQKAQAAQAQAQAQGN
jgi:hypothetical protein